MQTEAVCSEIYFSTFFSDSGKYTQYVFFFTQEGLKKRYEYRTMQHYKSS